MSMEPVCPATFNEGSLFYGENLEREMKQRGRAVIDAAKSSYLKEILELLDKGPIFEEERGSAVVEAAKKHHSEVVETLLANGSISEEKRSLAVYLAHNNLRILKALLDSGPIPTENKNRLLLEAAFLGKLENVETLLANGLIAEEIRKNAVCCAAINGHSKIITILLSNGFISEEARGQAVFNAANYGHSETITVLLANGHIPEKMRESAVQIAKGHHHLAAIIALGSSISHATGKEILWEAAERGNVETINAILSAISDKDHFCSAIARTFLQRVEKGGSSRIIKTLSTSNAISEETRGKALRVAAGHCYPRSEEIEILLESGPIPEKDKKAALSFVVDRYSDYNLIKPYLQDSMGVI